MAVNNIKKDFIIKEKSNFNLPLYASKKKIMNIKNIAYRLLDVKKLAVIANTNK